MEGVSLAAAFKGGVPERAQPIFFEHEGNRAVRDGKWKLVRLKKRDWELYNLEEDRTEMHDLAAELPGKVRDMERMWQAWAERADVLPSKAR